MEKSIVCVHGRGQEWQLEQPLEQEWRNAISQGIKYSKLDDPLSLSDNQIILVFYGDLFRPDVGEGSKSPVALDKTFEVGLADTLIEEAASRDQIDRVVWEKIMAQDAGNAYEKGPGNLSKPLLRLLDKLPGFSSFLLSGFVQDVDRYLHNPVFRKRVIDRVATKLKQQQQMGREVVLVAHSLGTVIAYDMLNTYPDITISSFVTLGSPLGMQHYIYTALFAQPPSFPSTIKGNWYNFYDADDIVALVPDLAPLFLSAVGKTILSTHVRNRSTDHHSSSDYLSNKKVGLMLRFILQQQ